MQLCRSKLLTFYRFGSIFIPFRKFYDVNNQEYLRNTDRFGKKIADDVFPYLEVSWWLLLLLFKSIKRHSLYIHPIWCFSSFISRNKQNKNKWLRLRWLRQRLAEAETETSHSFLTLPHINDFDAQKSSRYSRVLVVIELVVS